MKVTPNLDIALRHLRSEKHDRYLWIDAVCINQEDKPEISHQIARMSHIYEKAEQVLAWLGKDEDNSQTAMKFMKRFEDRSSTQGMRENPVNFLAASGGVNFAKYYRRVPWKTGLRHKKNEGN
jgi:hypothetical protein